jgi:hypothetical protein
MYWNIYRSLDLYNIPYVAENLLGLAKKLADEFPLSGDHWIERDSVRNSPSSGMSFVVRVYFLFE